MRGGGRQLQKNRMIQLLRHNKLFIKIFLYFLTLLIPIVILGAITYADAKQMVQSDVSEKLAENLKASSTVIDQYLTMARMTNTNLIFNDVIQRNLLPYPLQTDEEKLHRPAIVKAIALNRNTMYPIVDAILLYADDQKIYTGDAIYDTDVFFDVFYRFSTYSKQFWIDTLRQDGLFRLLEPDRVTNANGLSSDVIPSISTQYVNGHLATIVATISISAIKDVLQNNSIYDLTAYAIVDSQRKVIFATGGLSEAEALQIHDSSATGEGYEKRKATVNGTSATMNVASYSSSGWHYYSVTPISAFSREPAKILSLILWICVSLILIGIVLSLVFSLVIYNPIRNIREILSRNFHKQEVASEIRLHGELNMIVTRINKLFEYNQDVTRRMDRFSNEMLEKLFSDMINGHYATHKGAADEILESIGFHRGQYLCCCMLFRFKDRFYRDIAENDRLLILEKLKNVLWGILRHQVNGYLLELEHHLYVCVVNLQNDGDRESLDRALERVKYVFEYDNIYCELTIGVGKVYEHPSEMDKSLGDALTVIDQRPADSPTVIADASNMKIKQHYYYSFLDEIKVINSLKSGDMDMLRNDLEAIIHFNRKRGVSYPHLGQLLVMLFNSAYRYLIERNLNIDQLLTREQHEILSDVSLFPGDYKERIQLLFHFYERIIEETVGKIERKSTIIVGMITSYIEENYMKDLYLEAIASEFGMSDKYISSLFKETTGMNMTDFISLVRMTRAKELLLQTDLKIGEISERVGIFSRTTFLRNFKKHEGVSPMDYRKAHSRQ